MAADPVRRVPWDWKFLGLGDADDGPGSVPHRCIVVSPNASRSETDTKMLQEIAGGIYTRVITRESVTDSTEDSKSLNRPRAKNRSLDCPAPFNPSLILNTGDLAESFKDVREQNYQVKRSRRFEN
jgi:hypothetical protein